jgi:hypothetical protein
MQIFTALWTNAFEDLPFPGAGILFKDILYSSRGKAWVHRKASACAEEAQREMADISMFRVGFEPTVSVFKGQKNVHVDLESL